MNGLDRIWSVQYVGSCLIHFILFVAQDRSEGAVLLPSNISALFCLLCAVTSMAPSPQAGAPAPSPSQSRQHRRAVPGGERSTRGCISKDSAGNYFLEMSHGRKMQLDNSADIAAHVGQQVRVSGAFVDVSPEDSSSGSQGSSPGSKGANPNHAVREFSVMKVDVLASTCPAPPKKR